MEENSKSPFTEEYLRSLQGMKAVETDPFFYTRLKGKMQQVQNKPAFFSRPALTVLILSFCFVVNCWMIFQHENNKHETAEKKSSVEVFAETYNLNNSSNY